MSHVSVREKIAYAMGVVAGRTKTRWGKCRPWMLWSALPLGVTLSMMFTCPESLSMTGRLVYAYVTYIVFTLVYTAQGIPYGALLAVMSPDDRERTSIGSYKMVGAFAGGMLVQGLGEDEYLPYSAAEVAAISLGSDKSVHSAGRVLLIVATQFVQEGAVVMQDGKRNLFVDDGPSYRQLMRAGRFRFSIATNAKDAPKVYALRMNGTRAFGVPAELRDGKLLFDMDMSSFEYATPFFEVVNDSAKELNVAKKHNRTSREKQ